ncbi:hypothetical protein B0J18DRAFT_434337 [Chaetomium sp. MPI-SDFR-AT-0129]|nr:hypothetical protein B0J18DRAFT_434337 [Chaetomium sp. MPI-SDFR-AT-0129]
MKKMDRMKSADIFGVVIDFVSGWVTQTGCLSFAFSVFICDAQQAGTHFVFVPDEFSGIPSLELCLLLALSFGFGTPARIPLPSSLPSALKFETRQNKPFTHQATHPPRTEVLEVFFFSLFLFLFGLFRDHVCQFPFWGWGRGTNPLGLRWACCSWRDGSILTVTPVPKTVRTSR